MSNDKLMRFQNYPLFLQVKFKMFQDLLKTIMNATPVLSFSII